MKCTILTIELQIDEVENMQISDLESNKAFSSENEGLNHSEDLKCITNFIQYAENVIICTRIYIIIIIYNGNPTNPYDPTIIIKCIPSNLIVDIFLILYA